MSKIPKGATHFVKFFEDCVSQEAEILNKVNPFRRLRGTAWQAFIKGDWVNVWLPSTRAYRPISEHPDYVAPAPAWDGQGLPPVGVECLIGPDNEWCKIVAHDFDTDGQARAIYIFKGFKGELEVNWLPKEAFHPIRTADQIKAEEREKEIGEMLSIVKSNQDYSADRASTEQYVEHAIMHLHRMGYRKQEVV